jgi:FAD/FMN-containing dehydrogenase
MPSPAAVGAGHVLTSPDAMAAYAADALGQAWPPRPRRFVQPTPPKIAIIARLCPRPSARTAGGARRGHRLHRWRRCRPQGGVVLSMERLDGIHPESMS